MPTVVKSADGTRQHRNGHLIELDGCEWRCLLCRHWFDAAADADKFWCGDPCVCAEGQR